MTLLHKAAQIYDVTIALVLFNIHLLSCRYYIKLYPEYYQYNNKVISSGTFRFSCKLVASVNIMFEVKYQTIEMIP